MALGEVDVRSGWLNEGMTFRGKVALVTGAGSGIGQLAAWRLAADGATVAALDVDEGGLAATTRRAPNVSSYVCDVSDWDAVQQTVARVEHDLGPLDRVVHAAAIAPTAPILEQPVDEIRRMTEINYLGTVHVTKATMPAMVERGAGDLVLFASIAGWIPALHFGAYSATKFAIVSFAEILHHENLGSGVRIACVCPPFVDTPLLEQVNRSASKLLAASKPIRPEVVLDAIEQGLDRGELFIFPGPGTRALVRMRRLAPSVLWKRLHDVEAAEAAPAGQTEQVHGSPEPTRPPAPSAAEPPSPSPAPGGADPASLFERSAE